MALVLTAEEQRLADWAKDALPGWYSAEGRTPEEIQVFAKMFHRLLLQCQFFFDMTFIGRATAGLHVDWLDGLARELGTRRVLGEGNDALRYRLRHIQPAITVGAIEDGANALLDALGIVDTVVIEELPREALFFHDNDISTPSNSASYGFWWTPATNALNQRLCRAHGGVVIIIIPFGLSATVRASVLNLVTKLRAGGITAVVETKGA